MRTRKVTCIDDGYENWTRLRKGWKAKQEKAVGVLSEIHVECVIFGRRKAGKAKELPTDENTM
jgi:hypothetical protein